MREWSLPGPPPWHVRRSAAAWTRTLLKVFEQVETRHAAAGPAPHPVVVHADDHYGTVVAARNPRRHDPDHAGVPVRMRHHQAEVPSGVEPPVEGRRRPPARSCPRSPAACGWHRRLLGQNAGTGLLLRQHQLQGRLGVAQAPRGVDPRPDDEADVIGVHIAADAGGFDQGAQPDRLGAVQQRQAVVDQDAVSLSNGTMSATVPTATSSMKVFRSSFRRPPSGAGGPP